MAFSAIISWKIDQETMETVTDFIFWGSKITADGDFSHEIKRRLLLGRKVMTSLDSIFKSINSSALSSYGPTSHSYLTAGKTKTDLCHKVMALLCNMLSRFVTAFLPRSKCLFMTAGTVILEPKKIKPATAPTFSPSICHEVLGPNTMILVFFF